MQDPISDMLTRVRNALSVKKTEVAMPYSSLKMAIAKVLKSEGYIQDYSTDKDTVKLATLTVKLKYHHGLPVIEQIDRVSRPSLRIYKKAGELPKVKGGLGTAIISTSCGVMTDNNARRLGQGGEVLCFVS